MPQCRMGRMVPSLVLTVLLAGTASAADSQQAAAATAGSPARGVAPPLFGDVRESDITAASAVIALNKPVNGEAATMAVPGRGEQPAVKTVSIDTKLLSSAPNRLSLALPGTSIIINRRRDVQSPQALVGAASTSDSSTDVAVTTWVGEVAGNRRGTSSAILIAAENGGVYGKIRYFDRRTKTERTFTISPLITGGVDPTAAVSMSDTVDAASLVSRFPNIDTTKHVVMEVKEPDFMAMLAEGHEEREALLRASQTKLEAELAARKNGKPTSFAASSATASGASVDTSVVAYDNITTVPMVPPKDVQALAEAMAASAGEGASKNPVDYLAAATSVYATYSTPPASSSPHIGDHVGFEGAAAAQPVTTTDGRRKLLQTNTVHDLLVVYTPAAAAEAGGDARIQNTIRIAVEYTNLAYANSGIRLTVRLVGMRPVSYTEATAGDIGLQALEAAAFGRIPNVHAWRNELGADYVQIWSLGAPRACGVAYYNPRVEMLYGQVAFGCFDGITTAHELGHNQGCSHNREDADNPVNNYAFGHRRCDLGSNNFMTIMSYPCGTGENRVSTRTIPQFSSPALRHNNLPAGSATTDNARMIRETAARIAAARPTTVVPTTGGRIAFSAAPSKCVDVPNLNQFTQAVIWDCNPSPNMRFEYLADGTLRWPGTNRCLDVRNGGTTDGTRIQVHDCNGSPGAYVAPSKCLDLPNANTNNGNALQLWECGTPAQIWNTDIPGLTPGLLGRPSVQNAMIRSAANSFCLDVWGFNYANFARILMEPCNGGNNQRWQQDDRGRLRSSHNTAKCLDVANGNLGAAVYIHDCLDNNLNQRWFSDNQGRLRSYINPFRCLEIAGGDLRQGAQTRIWDCLPNSHFRWSLA